MFMERDGVEKIAKRTSRRLQWNALGIISRRNALSELLAHARHQISMKL
jgi:hypothetical protein